MATEPLQILDGVRRAKLYFLAGRTTVRVEVYSPDGGTLLEVRDAAVAELLSPKTVIDLTTNVARKVHFLRMENAIARGATLPPIRVIQGGSGAPVKDVLVIR
jgi:hypothetical protein